jgi:predicted RND superfamily exporter protein
MLWYGMLWYDVMIIAKSMSDPYHRVGLTGVDVLMYECIKGTSEDMVRQDAIVLPLALAVLAYILQSFRLMILPVIGVGTRFVSLLPLFQNRQAGMSCHVMSC